MMPLRYAAAAAAAAGLIVAGYPSLIELLDPSPRTGTAHTRQRVEVTAVIDGDTLRVRTRQGRDFGRVRLLGIDAPERAHPPAQAECYAEEATRLLAKAVPPGTLVDILSDPAAGDRDTYGRLLRYIEHHGGDVAAELVAAGAVALYESGPGIDRADAYRRAFAQARHSGRGIFSKCGPPG